MTTREPTRTEKPRRAGLAPSAALALAIAGLALVQGAGTLLGPRAAGEAHAAPPGPSGGLVNPADQRREIINELRLLNDRLASIEKALTRETLEVKVVSMPDSADRPEGD